MEVVSRMLSDRTSGAMLCASGRTSMESQAGGTAGGGFPPHADAESDARWQNVWTIRAERLERMGDAPTEEQRLWAMRTLLQEAGFVQRRFLRTGEALDEEYGTYYVQLASFVAGLQDARSIEALAVAADVAPVVSAALAEFGEAAVAAVVRTLGNPFLREAGVTTLGRILHRARERRIRFDPASMRDVRRALMQAVLRGTGSLQRCALRSLSHVNLTEDEIGALRGIVRREDTTGSVE